MCTECLCSRRFKIKNTCKKRYMLFTRIFLYSFLIVTNSLLRLIYNVIRVMLMPTVYIDVLFAVNFIINYLLLSGCGCLAGLWQKRGRVSVGALVGALYAILMFFPDFSVLFTTVSKLLVSMVMVACSFPFYSVKSYIKALFIFYTVSFGFGGCVLGLFYFTDIGLRSGAVYSNGVLYFNLPWTLLLFCGCAFYALLRFFTFARAHLGSAHNFKKKLRLSLGDKTTELRALLDTGNSLIDPVSLSPVIVAEYRFVKPLFSEEIKNGLDRLTRDNLTLVMAEVSQKGLKARLIPFSSVGKENGMLLGFVPDRAELCDDCGVRVLDRCVVGIYNHSLSKDKSYEALFNPYL